jgi:NADH-quinone oxidoreductase subunit G
MGPLIKTIMTRCIHCTRCIRFVDEIAGVPELGAVSRGEHMEVTTFVEKAIASELSSNLADVCPVGALTSKPYAFTSRPWELRKTESIDVMDALGSNIRVDTRGSEVMRVLPRLNEDINEEWLADKSRHANDGLKRQRLDRPYVRRNGKLQPASWDEAFGAIAERLKGVPGHRIAAVSGDTCDVESMMALKDLMTALGSPNLDCRQDGTQYDTSARAGYLFNSTIAGIEKADAILLIGTFPRWEAPLVNARIRKRYLMGGLKVGVIGQQIDLTYPTTYLGAGPQTLQDVVDGKHAFADVLKNAKRPMLILGTGALRRADGPAIHALARQLAEGFNLIQEDWNGFNVLHTAAARVAGLELGFLPGQGGKGTADILAGASAGQIDIVYLLGADEIDTAKLGKAFVIYQGHHGDHGAHRADVILPGAAYTEKNGLYVNTEGRVQMARMATFPLGEAREDWKIIRALGEQLGLKLPYDSLSQVRKRLAETSPVFRSVESLVVAEWGPFGRAGAIENAPFEPVIENYYMTDPISRASATMAKCTETFALAARERTGTHG